MEFMSSCVFEISKLDNGTDVDSGIPVAKFAEWETVLALGLGVALVTFLALTVFGQARLFVGMRSYICHMMSRFLSWIMDDLSDREMPGFVVRERGAPREFELEVAILTLLASIYTGASKFFGAHGTLRLGISECYGMIKSLFSGGSHLSCRVFTGTLADGLPASMSLMDLLNQPVPPEVLNLGMNNVILYLLELEAERERRIFFYICLIFKLMVVGILLCILYSFLYCIIYFYLNFGYFFPIIYIVFRRRL